MVEAEQSDLGSYLLATGARLRHLELHQVRSLRTELPVEHKPQIKEIIPKKICCSRDGNFLFARKTLELRLHFASLRSKRIQFISPLSTRAGASVNESPSVLLNANAPTSQVDGLRGIFTTNSIPPPGLKMIFAQRFTKPLFPVGCKKNNTIFGARFFGLWVWRQSFEQITELTWCKKIAIPKLRSPNATNVDTTSQNHLVCEHRPLGDLGTHAFFTSHQQFTKASRFILDNGPRILSH